MASWQDRERTAEQREHLPDKPERRADERQLGMREKQQNELDARGSDAGAAQLARLHRGVDSSRALIEHARDLLRAAQAATDRASERMGRRVEHDRRRAATEQSLIDREVARWPYAGPSASPAGDA